MIDRRTAATSTEKPGRDSLPGFFLHDGKQPRAFRPCFFKRDTRFLFLRLSQRQQRPQWPNDLSMSEEKPEKEQELDTELDSPPREQEAGAEAPPYPKPNRRPRPLLLERIKGRFVTTRETSALRAWWARFRSYHSQEHKDLYRPRESGRRLMRYWLRPRMILQLLIFICFTVFFVYQSAPYWTVVIDDAYITFRYVDHFVEGHGWRFNPGGLRVEGFTNFLWAVLLLIPHALGMDLMFVSKILGMASGILAMAASWGLARAIRDRDDLFNLIPPALLATNAYFSHWGMMGLETLLQVALVVGAYWRFEAERRDLRLWQFSPILAVLAAMTRIDSLYYLSPLGLYGIWLIFHQRLPLRRMVAWALLAGIPFILFWGWKWAYFGEMLPNTYYAKQRHVLFEGHDRAWQQLQIYYFDQAGFDIRPPADSSSIPANNKLAWAMNTERTLWELSVAKFNSLLWINFWVLSAVLAALAAVLPWPLGLSRRFTQGKGSSFFREVHAGKVFCLVLLPWLMNLYYVYHVNGDWMPSFRFFQIILPFIGVAAAIGFGFPAQLARALMQRRWPAWIIAGVLKATAAYLLFGIAYEQSRIHSVSIYGPNAIHWGHRSYMWWLPDRVERDFSRGFSPPLKDVSDYLLLHTQDDASIFMSDIGQPLWFARHLNLYDVDGLTNPYLAHAPSTAGRIPSEEEVYEKLVAERDVEKLTSEERERLEKQARRQRFQLFIERNADLVMERWRPEYLLIFINHTRPDPDTRGFAYPEISRAVYNHPAREEYVEQAAISKIGNVFNHVYRRKEVPEQVPDAVKYERLMETIDRNPRMPYLVGLLYEETQKMELSEEQRNEVAEIVFRALEKWPSHPVVSRVAQAARASENPEIAIQALERAIERNPGDTANYWSLSRLHEQNDQFEKAIQVMEKARKNVAGREGSILYHLTYLHERAGDFAGARRSAREAVQERPKDARAWSDYAALLERASRDMSRSPEERLQLMQDSLGAFENMREVLEKTPQHIEQTMGRLEKDIQQMEEKLESEKTPPPQPPAPENTEPSQTPRETPRKSMSKQEIDKARTDYLIRSGAILPQTRNETEYGSSRTETFYGSSQTETSYDASQPETRYR